MRFTLTAAVVAALPFASAFITGISGPSTYIATSSSCYDLTFTTASTMVTFDDLTATVAVEPQYSNVNFGRFLQTLDFVALGQKCTGQGNFTVQIPLYSADLINGAGTYVLQVPIVRATGDDPNTLSVRMDSFNLTFTATTGY